MADNFLLEIVGEFRDHISEHLGNLSTNVVPGLIGALAGLAAAWGVEKMSEFVGEAINAGDELGKLAQKTGVAVEALSSWQLVAALGDASNETLATGFKKLSKAIIDAQEPTSNQAKLFKELDIATKDSHGNLRTVDAVMADLSEKFANSADDANKVAVAMELLGKAGTELIPTLNGGKEALEELKKVNKDIGLDWAPEQTKQAEEFNDSLTLVGKATEGFWQIIAKDLLPILSELAIQFAESVKEGGTFRAVMDGTAQMIVAVVIPSLQFLAQIVSIITGGFHVAGIAIGGFAAAAGAALSGNFSGAAEIVKQVGTDVKRLTGEQQAFSDKLWDTHKKTNEAGGEVKKTIGDIGLVTSKAADNAQKLVDEYTKAEEGLMKSLFQVNNAGKAAETAWNNASGTFAKFTDAQKAHLLEISRELDLQTELAALTKQRITWETDLAKTKTDAASKFNNIQVEDITARGGEEAVQKHINDVHNYVTAQNELIKNYEAESKAKAEVALKEFEVNQLSEKSIDTYRKQGEAVAKLNQETQTYSDYIAKNRDEIQKLNLARDQLDALFTSGKISVDEHTGAIEQNSKAMLSAWANQTEANARFKTLILDDRNKMEDLVKSQEQLTSAFKDGTITSDEYQFKLKQVNDQIRNIDPKYSTDMLGKMNDQIKTTTASFEGMFSDYIFNAMQGKWLNLGDMVKNIIDKMVANMIAAQLQMALFGDMGSTPSGKTASSTGAIGGIFSSIFSSGLGGLFKADGGPVNAGQAYIVGENRPELFVPSSSGTIVPQVPGGNAISFNITAMDGQDVMRTLANKQREIAQMVNSANRTYNLQGA